MCLIFCSRFVVDKVQTKINSSIKIVPNKKNEHHLKLNLYCLEMSVKRLQKNVFNNYFYSKLGQII